jgi:hypothetical protein
MADSSRAAARRAAWEVKRREFASNRARQPPPQLRSVGLSASAAGRANFSEQESVAEAHRAKDSARPRADHSVRAPRPTVSARASVGGERAVAVARPLGSTPRDSAWARKKHQYELKVLSGAKSSASKPSKRSWSPLQSPPREDRSIRSADVSSFSQERYYAAADSPDRMGSSSRAARLRQEAREHVSAASARPAEPRGIAMEASAGRRRLPPGGRSQIVLG